MIAFLALLHLLLSSKVIHCAQQYETVCEELQAKNKCMDMSSDAVKWLGRETVDNGTCLSDCEAYARENNLQGCCFQNSKGSNRNCRFFTNQTLKKASKSHLSSSVCYQRLITDEPTVSPTFSPTMAPSYSPTFPPSDAPTTQPSCSSSSAPKNWQSWAALDYEVTSACSPDGDEDHACFGNGDCICDKCYCDVGWRGPYCSQLDLLPAKKNAKGIDMNGGHPTWGGSAVFEDGKWYLLAGSKIALDTGTTIDPYTYWARSPSYDQNEDDPYGGNHPWEFAVDTSKDPFPNGGNEINSARDLYQEKSWLSLYESEGEDASGPYSLNTAKWFKAFRADLKKDPLSDALLELSNAGGGFTIIESASGSILGPWTDKDGDTIDSNWAGGGDASEDTPMPKPVYKFNENGHCSKGWDKLGPDLSGEYVTKENGQFRLCTDDEKHKWNCHLADPALLIHPNGTAIIAYRGTRCEDEDTEDKDHTERIGLLVASDWKGPYVAESEPILDDDEVMNGGLEDLFMWHDSRGTHMIVHSQAQDHAYDLSLDRATFHHKKKRGAYLFSKDGLHRWILSDWELFPSEIAWDDGTTQFLLKQQRPSLIFDPTSGRPTHLVTGVDFLFDPCCDWYAYGSAWTLVQPISSCPVGEILEDGACTSCLQYDEDEYNGRCAEATSKYGSCVCAVCTDGFTGDQCDIPPEPIYEITCEQLESQYECKDLSGDAKWLGRDTVDEGTCLEDCYSYAIENELEGCCYQYVHPTHRNCRFFGSQGKDFVSDTDRFAAVCTRSIMNPIGI